MLDPALQVSFLFLPCPCSCCQHSRIESVVMAVQYPLDSSETDCPDTSLAATLAVSKFFKAMT